PGKLTVGSDYTTHRDAQGNRQYGVELVMSHQAPTLGVVQGEPREVRDHELQHQQLTESAFQNVGPHVKPMEDVRFDKVSDLNAAFKSSEFLGVAKAAAAYGQAQSDADNLSFDLGSEHNDQ